MPPSQPLLVALLGVGKIGRELIRRTISSPNYRYTIVSDTSGALVRGEGFASKDLEKIAALKEGGGRLIDIGDTFEYHKSFSAASEVCDYDVLIDVTNAQTYPLVYKALDRAHVVVSNKAPIADVPHRAFHELTSKAERLGRVLDFGVTVGSGMRVTDLIRYLGADGIERIEGCLSGTMNYVSKRINEGAPLSSALIEAMNPPRYYTEPDPRLDLGGVDFARKLTIIARLCGKELELGDIHVEDIVPPELRDVSIKVFLEKLPYLDEIISKRMERAKTGNNGLWYMGYADLENDVYNVMFKETPVEELIAYSGESDNVLKIFPRNWRRPVTIIGPGAGVSEAVTGLIAGLRTVTAATRNHVLHSGTIFEKEQKPVLT